MKAQFVVSLVLDGLKPLTEEKNIAIKIREFFDVIDHRYSSCWKDQIAYLPNRCYLTYKIGYLKSHIKLM